VTHLDLRLGPFFFPPSCFVPPNPPVLNISLLFLMDSLRSENLSRYSRRLSGLFFVTPTPPPCFDEQGFSMTSADSSIKRSKPHRLVFLFPLPRTLTLLFVCPTLLFCPWFVCPLSSPPGESPSTFPQPFPRSPILRNSSFPVQEEQPFKPSPFILILWRHPLLLNLRT